MENKKFWFFGSKLNTVLLLVLIVLMVVAIKIMLEGKETYFPKFQQQIENKWVSAGFENSPYTVNIWYPKKYVFVGGGDTESGTFNDIRLSNGTVVAQTVEGITFCQKVENYIRSNCVSPKIFYVEKLKNNKVIEIENYTSKNLGASVFAYTENLSGNYISNSENYIFEIPKGYYKVTFNSDQNLSDDFKKEFMDRLELIK